MPHSSDDPPSGPSAESLASEAPVTGRPDPDSGDVSQKTDPPTPLQQDDGEPRRPRRRRRRRRPPPASGLQTGRDTQIEQTAASGETALVESSPNASPREGEPQKPPRRRRRRRRGPPREAALVEGAAGGDPQPAAEASENPSAGDPAQSPTMQSAVSPDNAPREHPRRRHRHHRAPRASGSTDPVVGADRREAGDAAIQGSPGTARRRIGGPRGRPPREARPQEGAPQDGAPRERRAPASERHTGARDRRPQVSGGRGSRDRRPGKGRDAPQKRVEQRLYALESVVDRGFEDVTDESDDGVTRRVHWTIVKRTVADQKSGKPMSAVYVLQREGVDSEFPNLGAARSAANKTIVHPEKLTLSKAEHAAAKK